MLSERKTKNNVINLGFSGNYPPTPPLSDHCDPNDGLVGLRMTYILTLKLYKGLAADNI